MVLSFAGEFRQATCCGCLLFQPRRSLLDFIITPSRADV